MLCVGLGFLGVFIPLLPTTPFLLLALYFFARSSPESAERLASNKILGCYIEAYYKKSGMSRRVKIRTLVLLWSVVIGSSLFYLDNIWICIMLWVMAIAVSVHILMMRAKES